MTHIWGQYADSDTEQGIGQYERQGLKLYVPSDIQSLDFPELRQVVQACSDLLDSTYKGNYPQSTKDVDAFAESVVKGETRLFTLMQSEKIIAIASLVQAQQYARFTGFRRAE